MCTKLIGNHYYKKRRGRMRILIAEDDMISRKFLQRFLSKYGDCDVVIDGLEAIDAFLLSIKEGEPYDLICLDIMMPKVDGVKVLNAIRNFELQKGILSEKRSKVIMTTALAEAQFVHAAFAYDYVAYASKPIDTEKFVEVMKKFQLIE